MSMVLINIWDLNSIKPYSLFWFHSFPRIVPDMLKIINPIIALTITGNGKYMSIFIVKYNRPNVISITIGLNRFFNGLGILLILVHDKFFELFDFIIFTMYQMHRIFIKHDFKISIMININGAGPAGLSAGIEFLRNGYDINLFEKQKNVCSRFDSSYQFMFIPGSSADGRYFLRTILEDDVFDDMFLVPIHSVNITAKNKTVNFRSIKPIFWALRRGSKYDTLDYALKRSFELLGGEIEFGSTHPKPIIDATGGKIPSGISREVIFDTDIDDTFHLIYDKNLAPGAYAYLCVINNKATICVAVSRNMKNVTEYLTKTVEQFRKMYKLDIENPHYQTNFVSFKILDEYVQESIFVGESAGLQDGMFGFGLWYALISGQMAAHSIISGIDYDLAVKQSLVPLLKTGKANRFIYEVAESVLGNNFYSLLLDYSKDKDLVELLKWMTKPNPLKSWAYDFIGSNED